MNKRTQKEAFRHYEGLKWGFSSLHGSSLFLSDTISTREGSQRFARCAATVRTNDDMKTGRQKSFAIEVSLNEERVDQEWKLWTGTNFGMAKRVPCFTDETEFLKTTCGEHPGRWKQVILNFVNLNWDGINRKQVIWKWLLFTALGQWEICLLFVFPR